MNRIQPKKHLVKKVDFVPDKFNKFQNDLYVPQTSTAQMHSISKDKPSYQSN